MVRLNIPFFRQPNPDYCVPACIKMVLEYLRQEYGEKQVPRLSISTIARTVETEIGGGTLFHNVTLINERLISKKLYVRFVPRYPCDWKDIEDQNDRRKPIIAWIWLSGDSGTRGCGHSVVIVDIDRSGGMIHYIDPARGEIVESIVEFISKWENENVNRSLYMVEVERREQTRITEYREEEEKSDERTEND